MIGVCKVHGAAARALLSDAVLREVPLENVVSGAWVASFAHCSIHVCCT